MKKHEFVAQSVTHFTVKGVEHYIQFQVDKDHCHYINELMSDYNGEQVRVSFKTNKETRSMQQNRLLWSLLSTISDEVNGSHTESDLMALYKGFIREANIKYYTIATPRESLDFLREQFRAVDVIGDTKTERGNELVTVRIYQGSSQFDKVEMTNFIDVILRHASELGIETADVVELQSTIK